MKIKAFMILFVASSLVLTGCKPVGKNIGKEEAPITAPTATPTAAPAASPTPSPAPTVTPTPTPIPTPTPVPYVGKRLDFEALDKLDSTFRGWGVVLNNRHETPGVPQNIKNLIAKYDGHYVGDTSKKKVYIVFSASSEGGYSNQILDTLRDNKVQSVFFLVGQYVKDNPDLVRRMIKEGHFIGNHSMTHPSLPKVQNIRLENELANFDKYLAEEFGTQVKYFMPPSGEYSEKVLAAAKQMNYKTIFWSFAYVDFYTDRQKGADYAYNIVVNNLHNGAFIFLHSISRDNAEALDRIIKEIRARGYEIGSFDI